jgi:MATE family multidrug resistance protein
VLGYIFILLILFLFLPQPLLELFRPRHLSPENFAPIIAIGIMLLRFVAAYIFFDALYMVCIGVLKGAGDTRFIMCSIAVCATGFVFFLFGVSYWRYRQGRWKNVRVIEDGVEI